MAVLFPGAAFSQSQAQPDQAEGNSQLPPSGTQGSQFVLPPLRVPKAQYFKGNPAAWSEFVSQLPQRSVGSRVDTNPRYLPPSGGTWQVVTHLAPVVGICNPLLLNDGTVIVASCDSPQWYKLTPDITGGYLNGTWSSLASLPVIGGTQYQPQYHASAVLPDGRVIIMGGEYNGGSTEVWTNLGAIYNPLNNIWTAVPAPTGAGWNQIGDAESVLLATGTFMLGSCCGNPDVDALFKEGTLSWTATGAPSAGDHYQDEQGYTLLPNGNVMTIDVWTNYPSGGATNAEQYVPSSGTWTSAGNTPVSLVDPSTCGKWEIGPALLRPDATVVGFGGNTGCSGVSPTDPTAIYNSKTAVWSSGPNIPAVCGVGGTTSCTLADAPAALLPSGNILFAASAGYAQSPTHFFEFSTANTISQVADTVDFASSSSSYYYNFLVLPTGQILETDFSNAPEIYTPTGSANPAWAPVISTVPSIISPGGTYTVSGTQFNGLSQGVAYGDDVQGATNYPIVRITNTATGQVFYARSSGRNTSSIAPGAKVSTKFTVAKNTPLGVSNLVVIANGIASAPVQVTVKAVSKTTVVSSVNPSTVGQSVTFTATVSPAGPPVPTGRVAFTSNGTTISGCAAVALSATRTAKCTTTTLPAGTDAIKAAYSGDSTYAASTGTVSQVVN